MMAVRNWDSETFEPKDGLARPRRGAVVDVGIWDLVQWAFQVEGRASTSMRSGCGTTSGSSGS